MKRVICLRIYDPVGNLIREDHVPEGQSLDIKGERPTSLVIGRITLDPSPAHSSVPDNADSVAPKLSPEEAAQIQKMLDARCNVGQLGPECGETDGVMADWVTPMAVCSRSPGHWEAIHREVRNGGYVWAEWRQVLPGSAWEAARAKRFPSRFGKVEANRNAASNCERGECPTCGPDDREEALGETLAQQAWDDADASSEGEGL